MDNPVKNGISKEIFYITFVVLTIATIAVFYVQTQWVKTQNELNEKVQQEIFSLQKRVIILEAQQAVNDNRQ